jgi:hypothetical protein
MTMLNLCLHRIASDMSTQSWGMFLSHVRFREMQAINNIPKRSNSSGGMNVASTCHTNAAALERTGGGIEHSWT